MSWSRVKQRLEEFICEPLQGRVQFYITSYRRDRSTSTVDARDLGRAWVTVDGNEILSYSGKIVPNEEGLELSRQEFYELLKAYPDRSLELSLSSELMLARGIAMIDRRLGKRRLGIMKMENEEAFVKTLYLLRCEVEQISPNL